VEAAIVPLIVIAAPVLLFFIWFGATYNRFVSVRQHLNESWADIDVELKRRYDLVPNLVETVKGYAAHERTVLAEVIEARNRAAANHGAASEHARDETALSLGVKHLFAVAENYPDLKADAHFLALQQELAITEDRLAAARRFYNANVRELNTLCDRVPTNLVAGMFDVDRADYFELTSEAERVVPRLDLAAR
jgi:LemA protein